jgi:hypothetical protein
MAFDLLPSTRSIPACQGKPLIVMTLAWTSHQVSAAVGRLGTGYRPSGQRGNVSSQKLGPPARPATAFMTGDLGDFVAFIGAIAERYVTD